VISIIGLLLAMLLPGMSRAKRQSLAISCLSRLHQWAIIFSNYTNSNHYYFHRREIGTPGGYERMWINVYEPYYHYPDMRCCPAATNRLCIEGSFCTWAGQGDDWGWGGDWDPNEGVYGSYGINRYVINVVGDWEQKEHCWRRSDVKGGDKIPIFMDCMYPAISPSPDDEPPSFEGARSGDEQMQFACINRHLGNINIAFLDFSVRKVGLKELWTLKWARGWNTCGEWTKCGGATAEKWDTAAKWMRHFPEY
jgi:prepilin-type processing-associated H-X9-DG protein